MNKLQQNQHGFAHIAIVLIGLVLLGVVSYSAFRLIQSKDATYTAENSEAKAKESKVKIKSMPFEFGPYDPATKRAGDFQFVDKLPEGVQPILFSEFGYESPGNSASNYQTKKSPQPTVYLAAGTKIKSMIDGKVINLPKLYSGDYSIHVQGNGSDLIFEHEHVVDVKVKLGDTVKAGQVIAVASDVDASKLSGLGLFEMGILKGGNPPTHICMFDYLDDSIREDTFQKINTLKKDWETYTGNTNAYDEAKTVIPGCINREPISDNNNSSTGKVNN